MKHPNYPKATNQYLGTAATPVAKSSKENLNQELLRFAKHLNSLIERNEKKKQLKNC